MRCGIRFRRDLTFETWTVMGQRIATISNASAWCLGDWLLYGQRTFGDRYREAVDATGLDYQTLRNYAWVARRFELSRRRDNVSFQHHAEVAALPEVAQDLWLDRAQRSGWSRNELRRRIRSGHESLRGWPERAAVVVRIEVSSERQRRWREAAALMDMRLDEWIGAAADAAANAALTASHQTRTRLVRA
jgi:hypothetical protein